MGFQGAQSQGPVASKTSPLAWLGNLASGLVANQADAKFSEEGGKVREKFAADEQKAGQEWFALPESEKLTSGMVSRSPLVKGLASKYRDESVKRKETAAAAVLKQDPNRAIPYAETGSLGEGPLPVDLETVNGQRVPKTQAGDFRTTFEPPVITKGPSGPLLTQKNSVGQVEAIDKTPRVSVSGPSISLSTGKGETAFTEKLGAKQAERFDQAATFADQGYKTRSVVAQLRELDQKGIFSGPAANVATQIGGFAQTLGIPVDEAKLANSQVYQQQIAKQLTDQLTGSLARSTTDKDMEVIKASLPQMLVSPQGRQKLYQLMEKAAETDISRFKTFQEQLIKAYPEHKGMLTANLVDETPGRGVQSSERPVVPVNPSTGPKPLTIEQLTPAQKAQLRELLGQ